LLLIVVVHFFVCRSSPPFCVLIHQTEYQASGWKDARLVEGAATQGWTLVRDTMVRVPVVGAPMGPDSTRVLKVQKCNTAEAGKVRLETVAVTPDVPFGDCFVLVDEWSVTDLPAPSVGCRVRVQLSVRFVKSNWKLRAIKSMMLSRVFGENEAGFRAHVDAMRQWAEAHTAEVAAVNKASAAGGKGATLSKAKSAAVAAAATASAATPVKASTSGASSAAPSAASSSSSSTANSGSGAGPLDALLARLPPSVQKLGVGPLAGMAITLLLLIILTVWLLTSSAPAATAVATAAATAATIPVTAGAAGAADGVAPTVIAVMPAASASMPWWATLLLSLLVAAVGGLAFRLQQTERDVATLKSEIKALKLARN